MDPAVLAERRARRAEIAEDSLADRARAAESEAESLRTRLSVLERGLGAAADERDRLREELREREIDLVAARQREEAERRRRDEVQTDGDADRRSLEAQVDELRTRVDAAEARAAELAADVERLHAEADAAWHEAEFERATRQHLEQGAQDVAALSRALEARREGIALQVTELGDRALALEDELEVEALARTQAMAELAAERERADAEITLLQHELDRRVEVHEAVQAQLVALGAEVGRVRETADDDAQRRAAAEGVLTEVGQATQRLRAALEALERERDDARLQLDQSRAALNGRDEDLVRAHAQLDTARGELQLVRADAGRQALALADAEQALAVVRATADDLRVQLEGERRERESLALRLAGAEAQLRTQLEGERRAFDEKITAVERTVVVLRGRLAEAAGDLEQRLADERGARVAAESALAVHREAAVAERDRLESVHAAALAELAVVRDAAVRTAESVRLEVAAELTAAQAEAVTERRRADDAAEQARLQVAVELAAEREQVAQVLLLERAQAASLLAAERERADQGEQLAANVRSDRDRLAGELHERQELDEHVRATLQTLRTQLDDVRCQSEARAAREAAVEDLVADLVETAAALRQGFDRELAAVRLQLEATTAAAGGAIAAAVDGRDLAEAEDRLTTMRTQLEDSASRLRHELADEQIARRTAESALAAERLRAAAADEADPPVGDQELRADLIAELAARRAAEDDARAALAALAAAERELSLLRREHGGRTDALAVVEDLTRAARRLRAETESDAPRTAATGVEVLAAVEAPAVAGIPQTAAVPDWGAPPPRRAALARVNADDSAPALVRPHIVAPADRREIAWILPALRRLADEDPALAAAALIALLPAQATVVPRDLTYDVTIRDHGTWRVALSDGEGNVSRPTRGAGGTTVTVVGDLASLAPLAAGGVRRRSAGMEFTGTRRHLRKLLRARREPVLLSDLHHAGVHVPPGVLLGLLVRAVPAELTVGHDVEVDYLVPGEQGGLWRIIVRAGHAPVLTVPADEDPAPDATVRIASQALLPLLTALPLPPGERLLISGDVDAARLLAGWFAQAQGLAPEPR